MPLHPFRPASPSPSFLRSTHSPLHNNPSRNFSPTREGQACPPGSYREKVQTLLQQSKQRMQQLSSLLPRATLTVPMSSDPREMPAYGNTNRLFQDLHYFSSNNSGPDPSGVVALRGLEEYRQRLQGIGLSKQQSQQRTPSPLRPDPIDVSARFYPTRQNEARPHQAETNRGSYPVGVLSEIKGVTPGHGVSIRSRVVGGVPPGPVASSLSPISFSLGEGAVVSARRLNFYPEEEGKKKGFDMEQFQRRQLNRLSGVGLSANDLTQQEAVSMSVPSRDSQEGKGGSAVARLLGRDEAEMRAEVQRRLSQIRDE